MVLVFALVILLAYFIKSATGFAGALVSVPFLVLFFDIKFVVPVVSLIDMVSGFILFPAVKRHVDRTELSYVLVGAFFGVIIGLYFLRSVESATLRMVFGVFIIFFSLKILFQERLSTRKMRSQFGSLFGMLGGITGGMFSTNGPPIAFYLEHQIKKRQALRATLIAALLVATMWRNCLYLATGVFESDMIPVVVLTVPVLLVATFAGTHVHLKLSEAVYRKAVGTILLVSGVLLIM